MDDQRYSREEVLAAAGSPPTRGPQCHHCRAVIPRFADLSDEGERRILDLIGQGYSAPAMMELMRATGCSLGWAKAWVIHRGKPWPEGYGETTCPHCGRPLRTPAARQCHHCYRQWHEEVDDADLRR
jgi:hypothetical protein